MEGFKKWPFHFFVPKSFTPEGPQRRSGSLEDTGSCKDKNVSGTTHGVPMQDGQADRDLIVKHAMSLLSRRIICATVPDGSARDPPPRCHPKTRVELIALIAAWFEDQERELLLWMTGPAGVGKSAIVQTFAEYLAEHQFLGASVFISRSKRRNDPRRIFITIAYQLSTRIEAYRNFITERLSHDPDLLTRGMREQFTAFILEPFHERGIGGAGKRWGIVLDGLDELQGEEAQCEIIRLITTFTHRYRNTPLIWIIASRLEPHISNTFAGSADQSYWLAHVPTDSTKACETAERFLRSSFETMRRERGNAVPKNWPSYTEFLKLTTAASDVPAYAEVAMQFIRNPVHANPAQASDPPARLKLLLSIIDNPLPIEDNPFANLDALYRVILPSPDSKEWSSTKQLLSYSIHVEEIRFGEYHLPQSFQTLKGMAILFDLPHIIHPSLLKCYSTIKASDAKVAHKKSLTFLHTSFADYLQDPNRSVDFYVGDAQDITSYIALCVLGIWNKWSGGTAVEWHKYCSKEDDKTPSLSVVKFHATFFRDVVTFLRSMVYDTLRRGADDQVYKEFRKVHMIKLCRSFNVHDLWGFVDTLLDQTSGVNDTELLRKVKLNDLDFENLSWKEMSPACAHYKRRGDSKTQWVLHQPRSKAELKTYVSKLKSLQTRSPDLEVVIFGCIREGRVAAFQQILQDGPHRHLIPYPE